MSKKRNITLINDYEDGVYFASAKEIKNGLSLRGISIQSANGGHYYDGMVWGGDFKASDILMLLHSQISSNSGEIQSIVKWAKENKKPLIIVVLDDTPLICAWELILADYKQYQIIKYNKVNPNKTIFEIEKRIKSKSLILEGCNFIIETNLALLGVLIMLLLGKVAYDESLSEVQRFGSLLFAILATICGHYVYKKFVSPGFKPLRSQYKNTEKQSHIINDNTVRYKCFIAGATTIDEERDAVRSSFSQVANKWSSFNIRLSSYTFEDFDNNHQQQLRYNEFIENEADCVIVIIANGIGEKTICEYRLAVKTLAKTKKRPKIVVYADEKSKNDPNVIEFKKEVELNKTYWVPYSTLGELKEKVQNEMTKQLLPIIQEKMNDRKS